MKVLLFCFLHVVVFAIVSLLAAFAVGGSNNNRGVIMMIVYGFYVGNFKSLNKLLMQLCGIPLENKDYHEEERKRMEIEKNRKEPRTMFGKLIERLKV